MTNKKYWMGGGGNQKWGGYSEPAKPSTPTGGTTPATGGAVEGYDAGGISTPQSGKSGAKGDKKGGGAKGEPKEKSEPSGQKREPRREKTEAEKKKEQYAKERANTPEAKAERERKQALKAMTPQARAEKYASEKMFSRHTAKEYSKWQKAGSPGGHQKGWVEGRLAELKKEWGKGGQKKWMSSNPRQATSIRDKAQREEIYRAGKRGEKRPVFKNKPIKGTKQAKEKKTKLKAEMKPKTWKQNRAKGHGAIKDFKIHTPLSKGKK